MTAYEVQVSVNISPATDGSFGSTGTLWLNRKFTLDGENFAAIAARIDSLYAAIEEAGK